MENILPVGVCILFFFLQLLLCFKVKNLFLRLLPVVFFPIATVIFTILATTSHDWDALAYLVFAIFGGVLTLVCLAAWLIWLILRSIEKRKLQKGD